MIRPFVRSNDTACHTVKTAVPTRVVSSGPKPPRSQTVTKSPRMRTSSTTGGCNAAKTSTGPANAADSLPTPPTKASEGTSTATRIARVQSHCARVVGARSPVIRAQESGKNRRHAIGTTTR